MERKFVEGTHGVDAKFENLDNFFKVGVKAVDAKIVSLEQMFDDGMKAMDAKYGGVSMRFSSMFLKMLTSNTKFILAYVFVV
jgi:hypothetical protein